MRRHLPSALGRAVQVGCVLGRAAQPRGPRRYARQHDAARGTNLFAQAIVASTSLQSVAYKYKAGLKGLTIAPASKVRWRDIANAWQEYRFGGATNDGPVPLRAANRLVVAEGADGALAALPPLGKKRFEIPFDATGKKWVRFAAWDTAGNGAMVQPVRLTSPATTTTTR